MVDIVHALTLRATVERGTVLRFGHRDGREATDFFERCSENRGHYMASLKRYFETGKGDPFVQ